MTTIYKIHGLFWQCNIDSENRQVNVVAKDIFYEESIMLPNDLPIDAKLSIILKILNKNLHKYLHQNKIVQWFPCRSLTWELDETTISICYYHDNYMHNIITEHYDFDTNTGYFMQPNIGIINKLNVFYKDYDLDYYDADVISSAESL